MRARLRRFEVALSSPLATARGEIGRRRGALLELGSETVGLGEATPLAGWTEPHDDCLARLETAVARLRDDDVDGALSATADAPAARHAVSLARADRAARRAGVPLARHLDADADRSVPANATVGDADRETTVDRVRAAADAGFDCVKVKVGARSLDADVQRLRAASGLGVTLRADANGAWDRATAARAVADLATGVAYVEQPLAPSDLAGHADLRGGPVGVAVDESVAAAGVGSVLDADAADVVVLKPMAVGGPDRVREAARRVREAGATPVVTTTVDAAVARAGAVHVAASVGGLPACGLATADALARDVAPDPAPVADGAVCVPETPGLGIDPAEVDT